MDETTPASRSHPGETPRMRLPAGREMAVFLGGAPKGVALVMHHGTPSDATTFAGWAAASDARGLRLVCASRPGYATSTRHAGRSVADAAKDTAAILEALGH